VTRNGQTHKTDFQGFSLSCPHSLVLCYLTQVVIRLKHDDEIVLAPEYLLTFFSFYSRLIRGASLQRYSLL
jgi:hypothetical protein